MEQQYIDLLIQNISLQLRHPNYTRTIEVRNFSRMVATGEGQDAEITRYRRFEAEELKQQRTRLYNPLTKYALSRPRKYWKRLTRVENIRRTFNASDEKKLEALQSGFYNFMPGEDLETWQNKTLEYLGVTDPNAWIVYERNDERDAQGLITKTTVYPFIVPSVDALNFSRYFGRLQWFLCRTTTLETSIRNGVRMERQLEDYFLYYPGGIVRAREKGERTIPEAGEVLTPIEVFPPEVRHDDGQPLPVTSTPRAFYIKVIDNGTTEVPADCVGAYMDELTGPGSFVAWFDPAQHVFKDLMRDKSISDVLSIVYAYPKTTEYTKPCRYEDERGHCEHGWIGGNNNLEFKCPACKGTGIAANFTTEQERIQLTLPDNPADVFELSKLSFTEPVDISLLQHIDTRIETAEKRIMAAIFDSGLYQKPTGSATRTATEVNQEMDGIADVLYPFCNLRSRHFELAYRVGAQYLEFEIDVDHSFPEDLAIENLSDMVAAYTAMKGVVGFDALEAQGRRINQKVFEGSPAAQKKIAAKERFRPFRDKSPEDVSMIVSGLSPTDPVFVLWAYFVEIFQDIDFENPQFEMFTYDRQKQIVEAKVQQFAARMIVPEPSGNVPNFNDPEPAPAV